MAKKLTGPAKTAWDAFAQWVRVNGCIETTGYPFVGVCVTCKRKFHIICLDAGHMTPGRNNGVLFQEELVKIQCKHWCNLMNHGFHEKYREIMVEKYSEEQVSAWEAEGKKPVHDRDMDYEAITQNYREKLRILLVPFGYNNYEEMLHGHQF
jgi:hypothetical protein